MSKDNEKLNIEYVGALFGHSGLVTSLVVGKDSNDKPLVVSGSRDKKIIVWKLDLEKSNSDENTKNSEDKGVGSPFKTLSGHNHFVSGLSLSANSKYLVSSSWDKTLRLWDLNTFKTKQLITGHTKDVLCVSFTSEDRIIVSGSMDKTLKAFNIEGEKKYDCEGFNGWVSSITTIKQEKQTLYAVSSWEGHVKLYDQNFGLVNSIEDFDYGVCSTATDDEGEFLISAEKNGKIKVHALNGTEPNHKSNIEVNADINALSFESKYFYAVFVATSKGLIIQEISKNNKVLFHENYGPCHCLAWDETKTLLFAGFADGVIRVFRLKGE
jgi:guanine nucleotide-binding protein subunit beta-2-like 1 protein